MARTPSRQLLTLLLGRSKRWMSYGLVLVATMALAGGCDDNGGPEAAADYTLSLTPAALTIAPDADGGTTITITRANFTGAVTLSLGNAPAGVTGSFNPAAPTGTSSTLTVSVGAAVAPGVYNLTVDGTATVGNHSTPLTLTVAVAAADYTLSLAPAAFTIAPGANSGTAVTVTRTNFSGAVTLSLGNAPAGVTGSFNPAAPTGTSSTLTVSVGAAVAPGVYNLTVDGTATAGNRSTPLTLTVSAAPDYTLSLTPAALTIVQGTNAPTAVTITRSNFTGAVTLSLGNAPAGVTGSFNPAAPTGTSSTLTVSVGAPVAPGVYNLTVDGTATAGNHSTALTLTVSVAPDYTLSLTPTALTIVQGANAPTTVTITRTNFTGAVTLSLGNAPAGVTGSFNPAAPTGTSSTLTVSVGGAVAPGVYNLTVDGTASAGNRSTPLTLTVSAAAGYTLSLTPAALRIKQGANDNTTVTITRTNFTGAVTLSLGGEPAGVTGSFIPPAPTGTSSELTVSVGAAVAPGVYNLTVDGAASAGNRSTPLTLTVESAGAGNVTVDFSGCPVADRAAWLAYQDGAGSWIRVVGVSDVYSFNITSGRGGLAYVLAGGGGSSSVMVQYMTQAELTAGPLVFCPASTGKSVTGTAAGLGLTDIAVISLGGGIAQVMPFGSPNFQIDGVADGTHDLVGYRRSLVGDPESAIIRRDQNIAPSGSVGTMDFAGVEAFSPATATITVSGLAGGEMLIQSMYYQVGANCTAALLYAGADAGTGPSFTASGIPGSQQRVSDYHGVSLSAIDGTAIRSITEYFHSMGARTLTLGAAMPTPAVTSLGGPYKRLQAVYTLPTVYQSSTLFLYSDAGGKSVSLSATFGYLGGAATTLGLADYSGLAGWDNAWAPASASSVDWTAIGSGSNVTGSVCAENARIKTATVSGTF